MVTVYPDRRWTESGDRLVADTGLARSATGNLDAFGHATVEALARAEWGGVATSIKRCIWDHVATYIGVLVANATADRDEDRAMAQLMENAAAHVLAFAAGHGIGFVYSWEREDYIAVPLQEYQDAPITASQCLGSEGRPSLP